MVNPMIGLPKFASLASTTNTAILMSANVEKDNGDSRTTFRA